MLEYIYFVKCPGCEDEHFDFFNEAKDFAMSMLSKKPIITQIEVDRNDFGECTDSCDLGTVWSWEEAMGNTEAEPAQSVFTKADLKHCDCAGGCGGNCKCGHHHEDSEFAAIDNSLEVTPEQTRKPVPADMSISDLVEAMEANEDTVECAACEELFPKDECFYDEERGWLCGDCEDRVVKCTWCDELYDKGECKYEVDLGWLCRSCQAGIMSRGEQLTFRENTYWDFLDEAYTYLANLPDVKELIINELIKDPNVAAYVDINTVSIKPALTKVIGSSAPVGHVVDFDIVGDIIKVTLNRGNGKQNVLELNELLGGRFFGKAVQRACPAYTLLKAIEAAANAVNRAHAPTRAQRAAARIAAKDDAVLNMLRSNPAAADELKNHITKIKFEIPLQHTYEYDLDGSDPDYEAAVEKLNRLQDRFMNLPFAGDAIAKGIAVDRKIGASDAYWQIAHRWYSEGIIYFDCPIGSLTLSKNIIKEAKVASMALDSPGKKTKKQVDTSNVAISPATANNSEQTRDKILEASTSTSCYRLAVALIAYFDNDVEFYKNKPSVSTAAAQAVVTEAVDPHDLVELEYPRLTVTLYGTKRDVDDWDEEEYTDSHVFLVPKVEVATAVWENWITDEDAKDVEGGLDALEDDAAWEAFLETHFDTLFEKYNKQILDYFKPEALEDFRERAQEESDLNRWHVDSDRAYDEWRDERLFDESISSKKSFLEEFDDEDRKANLIDCPECGAASYNLKEQYCSNCGFNI